MDGSTVMLILFVAILLPIAGLVLAIVAVARARSLAERIAALERTIEAVKGGAQAPAYMPPAARARPAAGEPVAAPGPPAIPPASPPASASPEPSAPSPAVPKRALDASRLEQTIGGIWFQNAGSVLLLLGTFFLILWGYTQGKIGPQLLVLAGVALGVVVAWRGDRVARTIRPLGHAFLGVGLGVVYITLYVGHFRMGVFPPWIAFALLALVSFVTVDIGLRRAQPVIAGLGIAGAFIPLLFWESTGLAFRMPVGAKLAYLALANAVVFVLTAARGWSGLVLLSLVMTSLAWPMNLPPGVWGLPTQLALSAIYTALGIAPVIRLVRSPDPIRRADLAVVALAPILLLVESLPFFGANPGSVSGALLAGLGVLNLAAALWVDARRSERDLWRPLTAIGVIFVTAALERLLAKEDLALAWTVEGAVLVWLGLAPRGGWFRFLGYGVSALAVLRLLFASGSYDPTAGGGLGIVNGTAIRDLLCVIAFLAVSDRIARRREHLSAREPSFPTVWLVLVNALVMIWIFRESPYVARLIATPAAPPSPAGGLSGPWGGAISPRLPLVVAAWLVQAGALLLLAARSRAMAERVVGYAVGAIAFLTYLETILSGSYWRPGQPPIVYPAGLLLALSVTLCFLMAGYLSRRRETLGASERRTPEVATIAANLALLLWTAREAGHVASALTPGVALAPAERDAAATLAAVLLSAGWVAQAGALFALGWARRSSFLRWLGMGLVGLTLLKFLLFDLQRVDVFWRFVVALGVGAVLLLVSFLYQRRMRDRAEA
ncbi:MAG: DUF2339 domain-containing protein [Hyphomicrobiales bacterium]